MLDADACALVDDDDAEDPLELVDEDDDEV